VSTLTAVLLPVTNGGSPRYILKKTIEEAEKLGYDKIFVSKQNKIPKKNFGIQIEGVNKIEEFHEKIF
jgi:DNA repair protein RadA/Sms